MTQPAGLFLCTLAIDEDLGQLVGPNLAQLSGKDPRILSRPGVISRGPSHCVLG